MYKSPIEVYTTDIRSQMAKKMDDTIWEAVLKYDVVVDKEELVKALQYDRNQYEQGYRDAKMIAERETARKILKRIADECIIGIDSNLKCMSDQKDINTLWHNCLGKKTACQGIYDVVIELQEEYGLESGADND